MKVRKQRSLGSMGAPTSSSATCSRLKREDFRRTKHDSAFSDWKILIGAYDWEDHSMAKAGAEKYRTQNLPNWTSCPGVYELGIASSRPLSGRGTRKFDSNSVVPVYLGQADNLRTRLQQYGRDGSHLENGCSNNKLTDGQSVSSNKGLGLFTGVFLRGLPIVYRCAPMKSKKDAEITEKQLLDKFDYAWNKDSNGKRRQDDICRKLDRLAKETQFSLLAKKFLFSNKKKVGIKIKTCEPHSSKNGSNNSSNTNNNIIFSRIFGIKRLQPTRTQYGSRDYSNDDINICGVAIGHGSVCTAPPASGRKRCAIHKGLRIYGCISKEGGDYEDQKLSHCCGFILEDGSSCEMKPVRKHKRCLEHKGRKISRSQTKFVKEEIEQIHEDQIICTLTDEEFGQSCGFILEDGSACEMKAFRKNKRCLEHKGRKITKSRTKFVSI